MARSSLLGSMVHCTYLLVLTTLQRICEVRGWPNGGSEANRTKEILMSVWDGLRTRADSNQDGQVTIG